jgi:hypothetical protein
MASSENPKPIADPEEFEKESKRVMNKLRYDLDNLQAAEEIGTPLLRYDPAIQDDTRGYGRNW